MSLFLLHRTIRPPLSYSGQWLFHTSASRLMPRDMLNRKKEEDDKDLIVTLEDLEEPAQDDDVSAAGHMVLRQQRQHLYYMRLIEHDMPNLVAHRRPFEPASALASPLIIRSISYCGEEHPADRKRVIVAPVSRLPLKDDDARRRFKLIAGVRWSSEPPKDGGIGPMESDEWGYFKMSCEHLPHGAMNLKWASDTMDRLIVEANDSSNSILDIPYDTRHLEAKLRKAKKGGHAKWRGCSRPTLKDFPQEWLPEPSVPTASSHTTQ